MRYFLFILLSFFYCTFEAFTIENTETTTSFYIYAKSLDNTNVYTGDISVEMIRQDILEETGMNYGSNGCTAGCSLGLAVGGCPGAIAGGCIGGCVACCSFYNIQDKIKSALPEIIRWIEAPCFDIAFKSSKGEEDIWWLMIRLRPKEKGWRRQERDTKKSFESLLQISWYIEGENDQHNQNEETKSIIKELEKIRLEMSIQTICCCFKSYPKDGLLWGKSLHSDISTVENSSYLLKGNLRNTITIPQIIEVIRKNMLINGKLPKCSWSGQEKRWMRQSKNILNPAFFSFDLLRHLNVSLPTHNRAFFNRLETLDYIQECRQSGYIINNKKLNMLKSEEGKEQQNL